MSATLVDSLSTIQSVVQSVVRSIKPEASAASVIRPKHRHDFGGPETRLLNLRRFDTDISLPQHKIEKNFGVYLGQHYIATESAPERLNGFVVGIKHIFTWKIVDLLVYPTLDELKAEWELD